MQPSSRYSSVNDRNASRRVLKPARTESKMERQTRGAANRLLRSMRLSSPGWKHAALIGQVLLSSAGIQEKSAIFETSQAEVQSFEKQA